MKNIYIKADYNDANYTSKLSEITDEEINLIKPVIEAIKNFKPYQGLSRGGNTWTHTKNYPTQECHREGLGEKSAEELYGHLKNFDLFEEFVPSSEHGIHSIEEIKIVLTLEELL